jgi:hypothetical protein
MGGLDVGGFDAAWPQHVPGIEENQFQFPQAVEVALACFVVALEIEAGIPGRAADFVER